MLRAMVPPEFFFAVVLAGFAGLFMGGDYRDSADARPNPGVKLRALMSVVPWRNLV